MPNHYGTYTGFVAYCTDRGKPFPATDETVVTRNLLLVSEWLDGRFRSMFPGLKVGGREQEREWPRIGVRDIYGYTLPSSVVPREIEHATYEALLVHMTEPGALMIDYTPPAYKSVSVSGAVSVVYSTQSSIAEVQRQFTAVSYALSTLIGSRTPETSNSGASHRV